MATIPQAGKDRDWVAVLRRTMSSAWWGHDVSGIDIAPIALYNEPVLGVNQAGTGTVELLRVDGDKVIVGGQAVGAMYRTVTFRSALVGTTTGRKFWISDGNYTIIGVQEIHATAEVTAASLGAQIQKLTAATGTAQALLSSVINLKATANVVQNGVLISNPSVMAIAPGDQLTWTTTATATELGGVAVSILLAPGGRPQQAALFSSSAGTVDSTIFVANRAMNVARIDYTHGSASSGACNLQVTIDTPGTAPGGGTDLLTNNGGAGFDCQGTANVPQVGVLGTSTRMNPGDRISIDYSAATTGLTNVAITVTFVGAEGRKDVTYIAQSNTTHGDGVFFIADRSYEVEAATATWSTPGAAGQNVQLTIDSGTQAPGTGLDLLSNDSSAGFQSDGTANTPEAATFIDPRRNFLVAGDRLSLDFTTTTTTVGFVCTVSLRPA